MPHASFRSQLLVLRPSLGHFILITSYFAHFSHLINSHCNLDKLHSDFCFCHLNFPWKSHVCCPKACNFPLNILKAFYEWCAVSVNMPLSLHHKVLTNWLQRLCFCWEWGCFSNPSCIIGPSFRPLLIRLIYLCIKEYFRNGHRGLLCWLIPMWCILCNPTPVCVLGPYSCPCWSLSERWIWPKCLQGLLMFFKSMDINNF